MIHQYDAVTPAEQSQHVTLEATLWDWVTHQPTRPHNPNIALLNIPKTKTEMSNEPLWSLVAIASVKPCSISKDISSESLSVFSHTAPISAITGDGSIKHRYVTNNIHRALNPWSKSATAANVTNPCPALNYLHQHHGESQSIIWNRTRPQKFPGHSHVLSRSIHHNQNLADTRTWLRVKYPVTAL